MNACVESVVLLRFMDSFIIYTEPGLVTGAGRAIATFVSTSWSRSRSGSSTRKGCRTVDRSTICSSSSLLGVFHVMTRCRRRARAREDRVMHSIPGRRIIISLFLIFLLLPIYWLVT